MIKIYLTVEYFKRYRVQNINYTIYILVKTGNFQNHYNIFKIEIKTTRSLKKSSELSLQIFFIEIIVLMKTFFHTLHSLLNK